jgi:hypothetical protein
MKKLMKKMVEGTKQVVVNASGILAVRLDRFRREECGDAMQWVIGILITLLLFIAVYLLFKAQINTFVVDKIFGKMNSLD